MVLQIRPRTTIHQGTERLVGQGVDGIYCAAAVSTCCRLLRDETSQACARPGVVASLSSLLRPIFPGYTFTTSQLHTLQASVDVQSSLFPSTNHGVRYSVARR